MVIKHVTLVNHKEPQHACEDKTSHLLHLQVLFFDLSDVPTFVLPSWYYKGSRPVMNYLAETRTVDMCSLFDFFSWESVKCLWTDDRTNSTNIAFVLLGRLSSILQSSWNWRCLSVFSRISLSRISSNLQLLAMWRVEQGLFARLMYWLDLIY